MLTISLHGIKLHAKVGLYAEEKVTGNDFEIDVDVFVPANSASAFPFVDYTIIYTIVRQAFEEEGELLETFVQLIHSKLTTQFPIAEKIRVAVRKLNPPLEGDVNYSQVCYEGL